MLAKNSQDVDNLIVFGIVNTFRYTNYKGETEMRRVIPLCLRYGKTEHHPEDQWLIEAVDIDKLSAGVFRTFALKDIHPR